MKKGTPSPRKVRLAASHKKNCRVFSFTALKWKWARAYLSAKRTDFQSLSGDCRRTSHTWTFWGPMKHCLQLRSLRENTRRLIYWWASTSRAGRRLNAAATTRRWASITVTSRASLATSRGWRTLHPGDSCSLCPHQVRSPAPKNQ